MFCFPGVFTAAFDDQIEWLVVKGITDYADGTECVSESWRPFASVMAASVVAKILSDPVVFRGWRHYDGKCCFPLAEERIKRKMFFSHTSGSLGASVRGV